MFVFSNTIQIIGEQYFSTKAFPRKKVEGTGYLYVTKSVLTSKWRILTPVQIKCPASPLKFKFDTIYGFHDQST